WKKEESSDETASPKAAPTAAAPAGGGNSYDPAKSTASISGKISFEGNKPTLAKIQMSADAYCASQHKKPVFEQSVEGNSNNTLKDVLVYVKEGADKWAYKTPTDAVTLDQEGCQYRPHVVALMENQPLKIVNSDTTLHNIHPMPAKNPEFNMGQPTK